MYSESLKELINTVSQVSTSDEVHNLLNRSMQCYLSSIADQMNGTLYPPVNRSDTLIQASILSSTIANNSSLPHIEKLHYIVGMLLEQQGGLIARNFIETQKDMPPQNNDYWYHLTLAFLHYLAGGYRIQAITVLNNLKFAVSQIDDNQYKEAFKDIKRLFSDQFNYQKETFFINNEKISNLIKQIHSIRVANLADLGLNNEAEWLAQREITSPEAISFWKRYLNKLSDRGITTFTKEQINTSFDSWLRVDNDLLVVLPTGSGKTIIGELKTALTLAMGKQVVWLLPMRALVRQTQYEMNRAFERLNIPVQELPTTEDFIPLFAEINTTDPMIAITTPEKFLALARVNDDVFKNIGLLVVDEAQNLFENRGFAIEANLYKLTNANPQCKIVFLSAMADKAPKLIEFYKRLRPNSRLTQIISSNRPTRCSYGVFTSVQDEDQKQTPVIMCYPMLSSESEISQQASVISLPKTQCKNRISPTDLIKYFIKNSQQSKLKSIIFVKMKTSTEKKAKELSGKLEEIPLPEEATFDLERIKIERGVDSPFLESYKHKIAPHHGSLPKIEQIFIEKWIRKGVINHVIATPTLAQGVNLPFDLSIVTYLDRYENGHNKDLSQAEVQNMLGRAGRAGMVSDGLALISRKNPVYNNDPKIILDSYIDWFFDPKTTTDKFIGLSRILVNLINEEFEAENWILELSGFAFSEAMSLNTLLASTIMQNTDIEDLVNHLAKEIGKYPSINDLQSQLNPTQDVAAYFSRILRPIIIELAIYPTEILRAMAITGLPVEFIESVINSLQEVDLEKIDNVLNFATNIVKQSLKKSMDRNWFIKLRCISQTKSFDFTEGFIAIENWTKGVSWHEIQSGFSVSFERNLIHTGSFLNRTIPQLAQFWGCFAVCEKILFGPDSHHFDLLQSFIRSGVDSKSKFIVLKTIGSIDRVLAHKITPYFELAEEDNIENMQKKVRHRLINWKLSREIIPTKIDLNEVKAIKSILEDFYIP